MNNATDYIEVSDIIYLCMKPSNGYSYGDIMFMANRQAGQDVSVFVEPAIQYLEKNGDIVASAMNATGGRYAYAYYRKQ